MRLPADEMAVALLLIGQELKVLLNLERHDQRRLVSQVLLKLFGLHCGRIAGEKRWSNWSATTECEARNRGKGGTHGNSRWQPLRDCSEGKTESHEKVCDVACGSS